MPKTARTALKQSQTSLPLEVFPSGNPWEPSGSVPTTVPLPNDVIITKIDGPYTERDRKLWAFLVAAVWDDLQTKRIHEIRVSKINAVFHELGGEKTATWIWESARRLMQTIVEWESGPDSDRMLEATQLLSWAGINKQMRLSGYLRFTIHERLCEVIRKPLRFSRLRLHFMIGLSGKYAVTLYMLLESVANLQTPVLDVSVAQLRQWLKVPDEKLGRWADLKRRALDPALKQINDNPEAAGFSVEMQEFKEYRGVDRVRFILTKSASRLDEETRLQKPDNSDEGGPALAGNGSGLSLPTSAYEAARKVARGLDIYYLENEWREWLRDKERPANPAGSFVGFCKARAAREGSR